MPSIGLRVMIPRRVAETLGVFPVLFDRVKNVLSAGEAELRTRGRDIHLEDPERYRDAARRDMPPVIRQLLGVMRVSEFLRMRIAGPAAPAER